MVSLTERSRALVVVSNRGRPMMELYLAACIWMLSRGSFPGRCSLRGSLVPHPAKTAASPRLGRIFDFIIAGYPNQNAERGNKSREGKSTCGRGLFAALGQNTNVIGHVIT